jgi:2-keto-3-deoxy-L-rhamnonate aldolase RhmA
MSDMSRPDAAAFRSRFAGNEMVVGTFIKSPSGHATEILGDVGFDFVVVDQEHAPFGRVEIDQVLLAARAANTAGIVRVPSADPTGLLSVLDCGAVGVLVPHVTSQAMARDLVAACRYRGGKRGFSNSPRAGGYGRLGIWDHVDLNDAQTTIIAMIEDPEAVDAIEAIVDVDGLDGVFIGRGDLTVAYQADSLGAPEISAATEKITAAARAAGKAVCAMTGGGEDAEWLKELGVTAMIVASDQSFMRQAATRSLQEFHALRT